MARRGRILIVDEESSARSADLDMPGLDGIAFMENEIQYKLHEYTRGGAKG